MFNLNISRKIASDFLSNVASFIEPENNKINKKTIVVEHSEHRDGNIAKLLIDHPSLSTSEVNIHRKDSVLEIYLVPVFPDGLVPHPESSYCNGLKPEVASELFGLFGDLTWSKATAQELQACLRHVLRLQSSDAGDMWVNRASKLVGLVIGAIVNLRDAGHEKLSYSTLRKFLPLDTIMDLSKDSRLDETVRSSIIEYLKDLPGFNLEDADMGQVHPKCYENHGYLTMQIGYQPWENEKASETAWARTTRLPVERYDYVIKSPYKKVEYSVRPEGLVVEIHYHPKEAIVPLAK